MASCYNRQMVQLSFVVRIEKDFQTVWEYFSEFSNITEWDSNTRGCDVMKITGGKVGSVYNITTLFNGTESKVLYTTRTYTQTQKQGYISLFGENEQITAFDEIICRKLTDNSTEMEYRADICLKGVAWLCTPFIICSLKQITQVARVGCRDKARQLWGKAE